MGLKHKKNNALPDDPAVPDEVRPSDWNDNHVFGYTLLTGAAELSVEEEYLAIIPANTTFTLPTTLEPGRRIFLRNSTGSVSTAVATLDPGATRTIRYQNNQSLALGEVLTCLPGENIELGVVSNTILEILESVAVGPQGPQGIQGIQGPQGIQGIQGPAGVDGADGADGTGLIDGNKGDVTVSSTGTVWNVNANAIDNAKLAQIATARFKGRVTAGTGNVEDLTAAQVRTALNVEDGATTNSADATLLDRANHTGTQLAASISDFATAVAATAAVTANTAKVTNATHTGDVTGATALTIANDVVTNAKLANVATATIKGRVTAATGDPEDLTATQVRTLLNVADGATVGATWGTNLSSIPANITSWAGIAPAAKQDAITVSTTAPASPVLNQLWVDLN